MPQHKQTSQHHPKLSYYISCINKALDKMRQLRLTRRLQARAEQQASFLSLLFFDSLAGLLWNWRGQGVEGWAAKLMPFD